ncbi:MAG: hydrogen gas-evolving membrane-bound hydrogenase subunit E [Caldilineaceae bacterium]
MLLFVFILYRLPQLPTIPAPASVGDGIIAAGVRLLVTWLVLVVTGLPHPGHVATLAGEQSWLQAQGRNVVNVILVDFRSLDTLGEIVGVNRGCLRRLQPCQSDPQGGTGTG